MIFSLVLFSAFSENEKAFSEGEKAFSENERTKNYYIIEEKDGTITFIQRLQWEKYENIRYYKIEISQKNPDGNYSEILNKNIKDNFIELSLKSGSYRYRISICNALGAIEKKSDWLYFDVLKALQPEISQVNQIDGTTIEISGENLLSQSEYKIKSSSPSGIDVYGKIIGSDINGRKITLGLSPEDIPDGKYKISVLNPGGLSTENQFSYKKPEPPKPVQVAEAPKEKIIPEPAKTEPKKELKPKEETAKPKPEPKKEPVKKEPAKKESTLNFDFANIEMSLGYFVPFEIIDQDRKDFTGDQRFINVGARITTIPFVIDSISFGFGLNAAYSRVDFDIANFNISGNIFTFMLEALFQKSFNSKLTLDVHAGGGITANTISADTGYPQGTPDNVNAVIGLGVSLQFFPIKHLYIEAGPDMVFQIGDNLSGEIKPKISVGWKLK